MGNTESKKISQHPRTKLKKVEIYESSKKGDGEFYMKETSTKAYHLFGNCHFIAIYDGFGHYGGAAAHDASETLMKYFNEHQDSLSENMKRNEIREFIQNGIKMVQQKLFQEKIYYKSGTCCIGVLVLENKVFTFNIGNSRAILCTSPSVSGISSVELSKDHNLSSDTERQRVAAKGAKIHRVKQDGKEYGIERLWINNEGPGITTTRGLGCWQISEMLSGEPEIEEYDLHPQDSFLLIGSDGLWDVVGTEEAGNLIYNAKRGKEAVENLVKEAKTRWNLKLKVEKYLVGDNPRVSDKSDDISAIVCYLNFPNAEEMEVLERFNFLHENKNARLKDLKESLSK